MRDDVTLLAGTAEPEATPWAPFDPRAVDFLADLSAELRRDPATRRREAEAALAFWCRPAHLEELARRHAAPLPRLGRGLVFHLAPANVPTLFAYTLATGLLSGNANVVRLSSRRAEGEADLLAVLRRVLDRPEHAAVRARTGLITYPRDSGITAAWCARCDARVVWGGDDTVAEVRAMPMPPHAVELCFPDRWSLAVLSRRAVSELDEDGLAELARPAGPLPPLKGGFGLFYQGTLGSLEELPPLLTPKVQTLVCGGVDPDQTAALLARLGARGVDRVVPMGRALDFDTIWDGKDLIASLSRVIG